MFEGNTWSLGPSLPWPLEQHCTVRLNSTHILITGGLLSLVPIVRFDGGIIMDVRWVKSVLNDTWGNDFLKLLQLFYGFGSLFWSPGRDRDHFILLKRDRKRTLENTDCNVKDRLGPSHQEDDLWRQVWTRLRSSVLRLRDGGRRGELPPGCIPSGGALPPCLGLLDTPVSPLWSSLWQPCCHHCRAEDLPAGGI